MSLRTLFTQEFIESVVFWSRSVVCEDLRLHVSPRGHEPRMWYFKHNWLFLNLGKSFECSWKAFRFSSVLIFQGELFESLVAGLVVGGWWLGVGRLLERFVSSESMEGRLRF